MKLNNYMSLALMVVFGIIMFWEGYWYGTNGNWQLGLFFTVIAGLIAVATMYIIKIKEGKE